MADSRQTRDLEILINTASSFSGRVQSKEEDLCIRCEGKMVHVGFKIYRCNICGHEEKPEDVK